MVPHNYFDVLPLPSSTSPHRLAAFVEHVLRGQMEYLLGLDDESDIYTVGNNAAGGSPANSFVPLLCT